MQIPEHIEALRRNGQQLADAAERAGHEAKVPSCPEWVVRDLVQHIGGVHRWAAAYVGQQRTAFWRTSLDDVVGSWPDDSDLLDWYRLGHQTLVETLDAADPALRCFTFLKGTSPLAMWARRQSHETAIHRVDAELAAGDEPTPFAPDFAADGVDELVRCFVTRPGQALRADPPRTLRVCTSETDDAWLLRIGPTHVDSVRGDSAEDGAAGCTVTGSANDLYLALWNRNDRLGLTIDGDAEVAELFLDKVRVRWGGKR